MMGTFNAAFRVILHSGEVFFLTFFFFWDDMMIPSLKLRAILHLKIPENSGPKRLGFSIILRKPINFQGFFSKKLTWLAGKSLLFNRRWYNLHSWLEFSIEQINQSINQSIKIVYYRFCLEVPQPQKHINFLFFPTCFCLNKTKQTNKKYHHISTNTHLNVQLIRHHLCSNRNSTKKTTVPRWAHACLGGHRHPPPPGQHRGGPSPGAAGRRAGVVGGQAGASATGATAQWLWCHQAGTATCLTATGGVGLWGVVVRFLVSFCRVLLKKTVCGGLKGEFSFFFWGGGRRDEDCFGSSWIVFLFGCPSFRETSFSFLPSLWQSVEHRSPSRDWECFSRQFGSFFHWMADEGYI